MVSYLHQYTGLTWYDAVRPQGPAFIASVVMAGAVFLYQRGMEGVWGLNSPAMLFSATMVGAMVYTMALWIFRPPAVVTLMKEFLTDLKPVVRGVAR